LDSLHKPKAGQDDGGSEGHEEIGRKHAGTIGRAVAQGVSLAEDQDLRGWQADRLAAPVAQRVSLRP